MKQIRILAVGRIKTAHWQAAIQHYAKRLGPSVKLTEQNVKDADAALPLEKRMQVEGDALMKLLGPSDVVICLDEHGKSHSSTDFAAWLNAMWDNAQVPVFVIGGAFGLSPEIRKRAQHLMAFGPMTLPHELARVVLYEQLYRVHNILAKTGYHHE